MDVSALGRCAIAAVGVCVILSALGLLVEGLTREPSLRVLCIIVGGAGAVLYFRAAQHGGLPGSYLSSEDAVGPPMQTVHVSAPADL
jgi:hypothetical protein